MTEEEVDLEKPFTLSEFVFSVRLGKDLSEYTTNPPHVKAAKMMRARGIDVGAGDIIEYVLTKDKEGVKPFLFAKSEDLDRERYAEFFKSAIEQILDAIDLDFDSIIGKPIQITLESWLV